jgi:hypothetical protein
VTAATTCFWLFVALSLQHEGLALGLKTRWRTLQRATLDGRCGADIFRGTWSIVVTSGAGLMAFFVCPWCDLLGSQCCPSHTLLWPPLAVGSCVASQGGFLLGLQGPLASKVVGAPGSSVSYGRKMDSRSHSVRSTCGSASDLRPPSVASSLTTNWGCLRRIASRRLGALSWQRLERLFAVCRAVLLCHVEPTRVLTRVTSR